jgi:high-affinity iron transporter
MGFAAPLPGSSGRYPSSRAFPREPLSADRSAPILRQVLKSIVNITRSYGRRLALLVALLAVASLVVWALRREPTAEPVVSSPTVDAQRLVAVLQYLESDYPAAVASGDKGELEEQRSLSAEATTIAGRLSTAPGFAPRVVAIDARVREATDPEGVSADCAAIVDDLVASVGISRAPATPPDLGEGARLFAANCATCHGATGKADTPVAVTLKPRPVSFHSEEVMGALTPFKAFNVIRFGVNGTAMAPFTTLDEKQRWALAFYVFSLRQPPCDHKAPAVSLDRLANLTDEELGKSAGEGEVACLRRALPELDPPALLAGARTRVGEAARMVSSGDASGAEAVLLDVYLTDIEPIEPWLRARDPAVVSQLEAGFTSSRAALQQRDPGARKDTEQLLALLDHASGARGVTSAVSAFWFALLVIVREGFEAAVVIAALLAVLKKRKQISRARFVHGGWISALGCGALMFVLGRKVLAGAMNERLEGALAFVAAAMLMHAALWLNARTTTRKTMGELRDRTRTALDRGALALFGIAFLAMFRESFEAAVFLEALSIEAASAVAWGALAGTALLLGLVFAVSRLGLRLPMQALFKVSTVVLIATAVVLVGQGVHSFEEVGLLPSRPLPFVSVEFLGIHPDRLGLIAQLLLAASPLAWKAFMRKQSKESAVEASAGEEA